MMPAPFNPPRVRRAPLFLLAVVAVLIFTIHAAVFAHFYFQ